MSMYPDGSRDILVHGQQGRLLELMQQIADEAALTEVSSIAYSPIMENDLQWWQLLSDEYDPDAARPYLEYLALRNLIEYDGKLVRFVGEGT